ncbi:hypothetical protein ACERJO_14355 [Halalkalibacter sp. AB-rgal2]|uniref:hypothetical protein n=1 Tax=Halalkalibacter sp. AB-rgal2 TaxID=3242695 RepID=UPI00359E9A93
MTYLKGLFLWIVLLLISVWLLEQSQRWGNTPFFPTTPLLHILSIVTPITVLIVFGILLGNKHIMKEVKAEGRWRVNFPKLIILGIFPFLIVSLPGLFYEQLHSSVDLYMLEVLALILCGYYISRSINKVKT